MKPKIENIRSVTKTLKNDLEKSIGVLLQGREVHIIGEINML